MRRLPTLTKAQRRALLLLEWILLLGIVAIAVWKARTPQSPSQKVVERRAWSAAPAKPFTYAEPERKVETFPFDPNTADSTALLRLGLSPWQVRSIYRYRARLGRYHTPEDFMNVPHLTNEQWQRLRPYIRIEERFRFVEPRRRRQTPSHSPLEEEKESVTAETKADSVPKVSPLSGDSERSGVGLMPKLSAGETVDINTADTAQLKLIPGIASKRAARIVAYRQTLGGFVNVEQAMEAIEMPDTVLKYMTLTPVEVRKIPVNKLSVRQLMRHPYLSFYQAKAIFEHRQDKGNLRSIDELSRLDAFRPSDIDRLRPYLSFE